MSGYRVFEEVRSESKGLIGPCGPVLGVGHVARSIRSCNAVTDRRFSPVSNSLPPGNASAQTDAQRHSGRSTSSSQEQTRGYASAAGVEAPRQGVSLWVEYLARRGRRAEPWKSGRRPSRTRSQSRRSIVRLQGAHADIGQAGARPPPCTLQRVRDSGHLEASVIGSPAPLRAFEGCASCPRRSPRLRMPTQATTKISPVRAAPSAPQVPGLSSHFLYST
eukprot:scaffold39939_cov30-Tisochrysis_lutea.AAC.7